MRAYYLHDEDIEHVQKIFGPGHNPQKHDTSNHSADYAMTYKEIGLILNISQQAVEQTVIRALKKLRIHYME